MKTIALLSLCLALAFGAAAQTLVAPTVIGAASVHQGQIVRSVYYRLPPGGVFEFQKSADGGVTWTHDRSWAVPPEKFITPGIVAAGYPWYGSHWSKWEVLSAPGMRLVRCLDWSGVPVSLRPVF